MTDRLSEIFVRAQQMDEWEDVPYLLSLLAQRDEEIERLKAQMKDEQESKLAWKQWVVGTAMTTPPEQEREQEMKYQCVHQDSGLCETCFAYETKVSALTTERDQLKKVLDSGTANMMNVEAERDALQAQVEAMREALEDYGTHGRDCALYPFREYDPKRGYLYGDKWTPEPPPCTCGLTEAISLTALTESRRAEQAVIEAAKKIRDSNCADYCWAGISPPTPGKHQKDCAIGHLVDALSRLERGTQP